MTTTTTSRPISRSREGNAPLGSPERFAWYIACAIDAYENPKSGQLGRDERDVIARELGRIWAEKEARGEASCSWHEIHEWRRRSNVPAFAKRCDVCGGPTGDGRVERHEICRLRKERGMPTPEIDSSPHCACSPCRKGRGENA